VNLTDYLKRTVGRRRERTTIRKHIISGLYDVPAIRCTVCGGVWECDDRPCHRVGCLDAEMREATR